MIMINDLDAQFSLYIRGVSATYANILKYHIQGMPTKIVWQVFI